MSVLKLLPILYLVAKASAIWLPKLSVTGNINSNIEDCICPMESPTIVHKLDNDNKGVERLVIFIYKHPKTGKIISFIPDNELQRRIPDFPETSGHINDVDNLSIKYMFDNSPSRDIRENFRRDDPLPHHISNENKDNIVVVKKKPKDLKVSNENNLNTDVKITKWQIPIDDKTSENQVETEYTYPQHITVENIPTKSDITYETFEHSIENKPNYSTEESSLDISPEFIHEKPNTQEEYTVIKKPLKNNNVVVSPVSEESSSILIRSLESPETSDEKYPELPAIKQIEPFNHEVESSIEEHIHPFYITSHSTESHHVSDEQDNIHPIMERIKVPRKDKYGRIIGWTMKTIRTYRDRNPKTPKSWMEYQLNKYKPISHHIKNVNAWQKDSAFDLWLIEQLRITTLNGNRIPTSTADIKALDKAIRNVLLQSGWRVTRWGTLIDGNGKTSSVRNLKLRPILVGRSYSYDRLMKKQNRNKVSIARKRPYLEGLLLTMIKPPRILGIVPVSITSYSKKGGTYINHNGISVYGGGTRIPEKTKMKVLPIEDLISFRKDSKGSKTQKMKGTMKLQLLNNALPEIQQPRYGKGSSTTIFQKKGKFRQKGFGKYVVSEERPDWRIIGGSSAIISGTPLDFKGRSGLN